MGWFSNFKTRINLRGTNMHSIATTDGRQAYQYYLKTSGTYQPNVKITKVGEPLITSSTQTVPCTIRTVKNNDEKNYDQKYLTVPYNTDVSVGSYLLWRNITYLLIFEEIVPINTHRSFVIRKCNTVLHGFDKNNNIVEIPMSTHIVTASDSTGGIDAGKFIDYKKDKVKILLPNIDLVKFNIKIGNNIFLSEYTTFKVTEIDDYSLQGLLTVECEQTLLSPNDNIVKQITNQQEQEYKPKENSITSNSGIIGSNTIKIGNSSTYTLTSNTDVIWNIVGNTLGVSIITISKNSCKIFVKAKGRIVGNTITLQALDNKGNLLNEMDITLESII